MKQPLVSVIIPVYNHGRYLAEAIDSVLAQSYTPLEIIVVNDGSTDETPRVAEAYGDKIAYYYKPNAGLSHTRNFGVAHGTGKYMAFVDADDKLKPNFLAKAVALLEADHGISFVYTQTETFGRDNTISNHAEYSVTELKEHNYINAGVVVRASVFQEVHYNQTMRSGWEDWDFYISLAERGLYGKLLDQPLYLYRKHPEMDSMSDAMASEKLQRRLLLGLAWRHPKFFGRKRVARLAAFNVKRDLHDIFRANNQRG